MNRERLVVVTGGCGYTGSVLVPKLLAAGWKVRVVDAMWFGRNLPPDDSRLEVVKQDIRDGKVPVDGADAVVHLAAIANDPCGELDAKLTWEVNVLALARLADRCIEAGVRQFLFASSASIYGIKNGMPVKETESFEPVSDYNKTKLVGERVLMSYADRFALQIVRPATVCGMSPRMRLDVVVNMLTMQALERGHMTAHCGQHGGELIRPHATIEDLTDLYCWLLVHPEVQGAFNAGFENLSITGLAALIVQEIPATIEISPVIDKRSYAVDSTKILHAGFHPSHSVVDAIRDMHDAYATAQLQREPRSINLEWMRQIGVAA